MIDRIEIQIHDRNFLISMNSVIHNQFQAPSYNSLWKAAWKNAGFDVTLPNERYKSIKEINFEFDETICEMDCQQYAFITCSYETYEKIMCVSCFVLKTHLHNV